MIGRWIKTVLAILALLFFYSLGKNTAWAENSWGFGSDIGFLADTVNDTVFTLSFQGDYYLDSDFSVGPQVLITPGGDLTQLTFAGIARYHVPMGSVSLVPFGGIGFVYGDYERKGKDDREASYSFPFGATFAFHVSQKISLASTLIFTLQDLEFDNRNDPDRLNVGVLFGFRFHP